MEKFKLIKDNFAFFLKAGPTVDLLLSDLNLMVLENEKCAIFFLNCFWMPFNYKLVFGDTLR